MEKIKVLVADDDPLSLALLQAQLSTWGYDVVTAEDGEEARELLRFGGFAVCILDWMMPKMTGLDLCRWIKTHMNPAPHVMMLTSRSAPEDMHAGYAAGADDYMSKPADRVELRSRLQHLAVKALHADEVIKEFMQMDPVDLYRRDLDLYSQHRP